MRRCDVRSIDKRDGASRTVSFGSIVDNNDIRSDYYQKVTHQPKLPSHLHRGRTDKYVEGESGYDWVAMREIVENDRYLCFAQ